MTARRWLLLAAFGALGAAVLKPPHAHADPLVVEPQVANYAAYAATALCGTLDDYPTLTGVAGVLRGVMSDSGFSSYQAGEVIALAVKSACPRHTALVLRFADAWAPVGSTV